jgi:hypothetical protein
MGKWTDIQAYLAKKLMTHGEHSEAHDEEHGHEEVSPPRALKGEKMRIFLPVFFPLPVHEIV